MEYHKTITLKDGRACTLRNGTAEDGQALLSNAGFLIYEHMDADEATDAFLKGSGMTAPAGVGYCLAVRKG